QTNQMARDRWMLMFPQKMPGRI
ncbi:uncharacterized protein METZ01_LOCUS435962, partial [marine metagenome]